MAKQNIKFTKIQELECEIQNYLDENFRLKTLLSNSSYNKNQTDPIKADQFIIQHKLIIELKEKLKNLNYSNEKKEEENIRLQVDNELNSKRTTRYLEEIKNLRKNLTIMKDEKKTLKEENTSLSLQISQLVAAAQSERNNEKEKKMNVNEEFINVSERDDSKKMEKTLRNLLGQKEQVILYQEKTISDLRAKIEVKFFITDVVKEI